MGLLAPLFLLGLATIAVPVILHMIQRERKDEVEFPSLMFLRKVPYRSFRRQRIRHWFLLLLRCAALLLLLFAFARPFIRAAALAAVTDGAREALAAEGIGAIDGLGNIRLELPGLLVRVDGAAQRPRTKTRAMLSGKSSLIAQAMLLDTERSWHVADLAEHSGVSPALAHRVLQRLGDLEIVTSQGAGPSKRRRLVEPSALFDLWIEEHRDRSRRYPAFMLASATDDVAATACRGLETAGVTYALTGAAAIARIAPILTSIPVVEVWLDGFADPGTVCAEIGADQVTSGPNVVLQQERDDVPLAYRTQRDGVWLANVCRLYIDVRRDPQRGSEQADHLRRQAIGF